MAETEALIRLRFHELLLHAFPKGSADPLFRQATNGDQGLVAERVAKDGRGPDDLGMLSTQAGESLNDRLTYSRRQFQFRETFAVPLQVCANDAASVQCALEHLLKDEGI